MGGLVSFAAEQVIFQSGIECLNQYQEISKLNTSVDENLDKKAQLVEKLAQNIKKFFDLLSNQEMTPGWKIMTLKESIDCLENSSYGQLINTMMKLQRKYVKFVLQDASEQDKKEEANIMDESQKFLSSMKPFCVASIILIQDVISNSETSAHSTFKLKEFDKRSKIEAADAIEAKNLNM